MRSIERSRASHRRLHRSVPVWAWLTIGLLTAVSACTAGKLRAIPSQPLETILSRGTVGEIEIALEPFETDEKTLSILDKTLISAGVLPVLVVLRNRGDVVYELNPNEILLLAPDGDRSAAASMSRVGRTTGRREQSPQTRDAVAVTSSILAPISLRLLPLYISKESAQAHNRRLAREYLAMGLPHYIPHGETRGLIFFQIPKGTAIALDGYRVRFETIGPSGFADREPVEIPLVPSVTR
jgi:hypothetical protein